MKKLIIAANLGKVRVLKHRAAGEDPIEQDHLIEIPEKSSKQHVATIQEAVTDQPGKFGRGTAAGLKTAMSYGEEHNLEKEMERNALKSVAARIEHVLDEKGYPPWILAAPQSILARLKEFLPPAARKALTSDVGADLTQCPLQELEARFL